MVRLLCNRSFGLSKGGSKGFKIIIITIIMSTIIAITIVVITIIVVVIVDIIIVGNSEYTSRESLQVPFETGIKVRLGDWDAFRGGRLP